MIIWCGIMVDWWYCNNLFSVEDGLFYENGKRLGYFQDEKEDEIPKNNHKATVDRMLELREVNIEFKRIHNKLKKENKELKAFLTELADSQGNIYHMNGRVYNIQEVI